MSYAAPISPPPNAAGSSQRPNTSSNGYAPTTVPTAGHPLLLNGKMLVYPSGWRGCPKCHDTGYKQNDPTHPCRKCWQSYGQPFNPLLISSSNLQGAKVLQRPLLHIISGPSMNQSHAGGWAQNGFARYPGTSHQDQHHQIQSMHAGRSFQPPHQNAIYQPPPHPPAPTSAPALPPRRTSPPRVNRTEDAREDKDDDEGEAPPAYADAVAAGPSGALPPQRRDEHGNLPSSSSNSNNAISPQATGSSHNPIISPSSSIPGSFPPSPQHPHQQQYYQPPIPTGGHQAGYGPDPGPGPWPQYHSQRPPAMQPIPVWGRPPPGALVLRPGDPRIGGQLCFKCGGAGVRESLWFGDETCSRCGGSGRVF